MKKYTLLKREEEPTNIFVDPSPEAKEQELIDEIFREKENTVENMKRKQQLIRARLQELGSGQGRDQFPA